ncbi:LysM peptidoglycan-binding domain-containing protein [Streptomyces sp. NPDC004111]|uniref:LysM peptidoglycan-binding domain-containing protein n=1 Tax=Streptomyces sp. NPDC004111 TaxID=3364690 RepID=UPI003680649B
MTPNAPTRPTTPRARRGALAVVRALLCLVAVLLLVGGLPVLLWHASAAVWAPGIEALAHLLTRQDTSAVFLLALTALGWAGWGAFTLSLVVEVPAQLRGLRAPRLPGLGAGQRAAATLVGGILILLPAGTAFASPAQASPVAVTAPQAPQTTPAENTQGAKAAAGAEEAATYTVREMRPAESLWSIAEAQLGDGTRYTEIADLNQGRTMTDGRTFDANAPIQPGWKLRMPAPPRTPEVPAPRPQESTGTDRAGASYTVVAGDTLTGIAEDQLGDAEKFEELFTANKGSALPGGGTFTDPDEIEAGQHLTLPTTPPTPDDQPKPQEPQKPGPDRAQPTPSETSTPTPTKPEPSKPAAEKPAPAKPSTAVPSPAKPSTAVPQPATSAPAKPPASASSTPSSPAPSATPDREAEVPVPPAKTPTPSAPTTTPPPAAVPGGAATGLDMQTMVGTGALLAGSAVTALALKRLLQRRRRKPGQRIAIGETSQAEQALAATAAQASPDLLDHALRALAHRAAGTESVVPVLRAARVGSRTVAVLPDDLSAEPAWPFTAGTNGWWKLPEKAELPQEARDTAPPYPGLVTLGSGPDGSLLLLNLPSARHLLLEGSTPHIEQVGTSLALELSSSPWAADSEVLVVGFGGELPKLLPTTRIRYVEQAAHAVRDLAERAIEAHQDDEDAPARPWILIIAGQVSSEDAWALADALDKARNVPACVVLPAADARTHFPDADVLDADLDDTHPQPLPSLGVEVRLQRMEPAAYQDVLASLATAEQPAHNAEGPWANVPGEDSPGTEVPASEPAPEKAVNGTPVVLGKGEAAADPGAFPSLLAAVRTPTHGATAEATAPAPDDATGVSEETAKPTEPDTGTETKPGTETEASEAGPEPAATDQVPEAGAEAGTPRLRVLGAVEVTGLSASGHGPKLAQLAALLHLRPGRDRDSICTAMDPTEPWTPNTLMARLSGLRSQLGSAPDGTLYVPRRRTGTDPYALHPQFPCDWHQFLALAERGLVEKAVAPLDAALALVRGRPFGTHPPEWAHSLQQDMLTRIVDIAHTSARHHTKNGDYPAARQALAIGLEVDETAELLYRDLLLLEHAHGNRAGLHATIALIQKTNRDWGISMDPDTEHLIAELTQQQTP